MSHVDTLYLVDGSGFIFRAFYAIGARMTAPDGTPTNAVFGFVRLLLNVLKDRDPAHVAVVFDASGPSFRNEIYPEYKANRREPPDELKPQFALCREAVRALGIPALELPGYEADDIIGTLACKWIATGRPCVVVTADKDFMQLVEDGQITLWDGKERDIDREAVIDKFGVPPERVVDVLALAGDSSDNIPGVPGIGPKTATTLLQKYGDLDTLLAEAASVGGKRGQALVDFAEQARLSRRLAAIERDAPIELDEEALLRTPPDPDTLAEFLRRLNFKSFLKEFGLEGEGGGQIDRSGYRTILTRPELDEVVEAIRRAGRLALDLETTSLDTLRAEIVGFAVAWAPGEAAYIPVAHRYTGAPEQLSKEEVLAALRPILTDPAFPKFGQNFKYEWQVLCRDADLDYVGLTCDSLLAAYLLDPNRRSYKLDELASDFLGHRMIAFHEVTAGTADATGSPRFGAVDVHTATRYAGEDADVALRLCDFLMPRLEREGLAELNRDIEVPLARVLARMELHGVRLDADMLRRQSAEFAERIAALEAEVHEIAGEPFNIGSSKQLAEILFERLQLPTGKKTKTGYSTDQSVLEQLALLHPLPEKVLAWRHLSKLKGTYLDTLPQLIHPITGRLHTSFQQFVAATGRISSSEPNLQNIPIRTAEGREIRRAFVPDPGWKLLSADYSQIELRLLAHISDDPALLDAFARDEDVHARTAAEIFGLLPDRVTPEQRRQAKAINFGLIYGMGAYRLANDLGIGRGEAKAIIDRYFERYRGVRRYFDETVEQARREQRVKTLLGRIRPLPDIHSRNHALRQHAERTAVNTPIQGTAADLLKLAMVRLDRRLEAERRRTRLLLTVHDELVLEVPEDELAVVPDIVREEMERAYPLKVPLKVEVGIGESWADIH